MGFRGRALLERIASAGKAQACAFACALREEFEFVRPDPRWRYVAGLGSGFFLGTLASLAWMWDNYRAFGGEVGYLLLLVGGAFLSVAYRSATVWLAECGALYCWWWLQGQLAPFPPSECSFLFCSGGMMVVFHIFGTLAAIAGYLISIVCRLLKRPPIGPRAGLGLGLVASLVLVSSGAIVLVSPSKSSYAIDLPAGWAPYSAAITWLGTPESGTVYRAAASPVPARTGLYERPPVPMLGVSVVRQDLGLARAYTPSECLDALDTWGGGPSWLYRGTPVDPSPALKVPGAVTVRTADGDRIYGLGVPRTRWVGLVPEKLCYLVVVSVPAASTMSDAEVGVILSSFRLR